MKKLNEIEKQEILNNVSTHDKLCRISKEIKEMKIYNLEDMKKVATLLESKSWVAIYATINKDHVILLLSRIWYLP